MTLRASSCKGTLLRKNLSQFWLLPAGILAVLFVQTSLVLTEVATYPSAKLVSDWSYILRTYTYNATEVWSSILIAAVVFSYLHNTRRSCFFHSIPCTRDSLFLSSYVSGILFYTVPWFLIASFSALRIFFLRGDDLFFFTTYVQSAIYRLFLYITFYSFGTLGMVLSGRTFFGILTTLFFAVIIPLVESFFMSMVGSLLFGVPAGSNFFSDFLSPFYLLSPKYGEENSMSLILAEGGAYAAASLLLSYIALLIHRRRKEENVGQSLIFSPILFVLQIFLTPIFSLICVIPVALIAKKLSIHILIPFSIPAFFLARMLLLRSGKVFQKRAFVGCGIYVLILCAFLFSFQFDLFGIVRRIPEVDRVQNVRISFSDGTEFTSQDPGDVEDVISIHKNILAHQPSLENEANYEYESKDRYLYITYTMGRNRTISRTYHLSGESTDRASAEITAETEDFFRQSHRVEQQLKKLREETDSISFITEDMKTIDLSTLQQQAFFQVLEEDIASGADPLFLYGGNRGGAHVILFTSSQSNFYLSLTKEATAIYAFLEEIERETSPKK